MSTEQWRRVKQVLQETLDLNTGERTAFLQQACADDAELRQYIEALLASDRCMGDFLAEPAIHLAGACETELERTHQPAVAGSHELQQVGYVIGREYMPPQRFRQIRNLFEVVIEKPPLERMIFLNQASQGDEPLRHEVQRMLATHDRTATLDGAVAAPAVLRTDPRHLEGRRLGSYEILREIGRGGMGTVYLARRADELFHQQVAIKVVTPESAGPEVIERFYQEREILASLEHPNIGRIYDGGSTEEGWPYIVMEYVEGKPIDAWCDERKLNVSERLRLFQTVCAAVHYAHQHRVVHRDLKPANILVSNDGVVKLLDFGIAKLVQAKPERQVQLTREGMRLMTPEYASPEQIRGEETTPLADIYALGVILYQLLTGRRPYRFKSRISHEIMRVVCEEPPMRPSTAVMENDERITHDGKTLSIAPAVLSRPREGTPVDLKRRLAGDLDNILLKALEKDPIRRYRTMEQFRMDVERHLNGLPVLARKNTWWMRAGRLAERHKIVLVLGAGFLLAIIAGGVRITWTGAAYLAGVMILLALWHTATDPRLASWIARFCVNSVNPVLFLLLFLGIVLFVSSAFPLQIPWRGRVPVLSVVAGLLGYCWLRLAGWFFRHRWAGILLLKIKVKDRSKVLIVRDVLVVFIQVFLSFRLGWTTVDELWIAAYLSACLLTWVTEQHLEILEKGLLLVRGRWIPWMNIESYSWEADKCSHAKFSKVDVIHLKVQRLFHIVPPPRIPIAHENHGAVEAILRRHLEAWPAQESSSNLGVFTRREEFGKRATIRASPG